jgi:hypothetical protein
MDDIGLLLPLMFESREEFIE